MKRKFDTFLLAFSLFCISGAMLFYNLRTTENTSVSTSPGELLGEYRSGVIAVAARAYDTDESEDSDKSVTTELESEDAALLAPIIKAVEQ